MGTKYELTDFPSPNGSDSPVPPVADPLESIYVIPAEEIESETLDDSDLPVVAKPGKQTYFRAHPVASWVVPLLKIDATGTHYLCARALQHPDIRDHRLFLVRTHLGRLLLWPVPLPQHGEDNPSSRQQRAIAADAQKYWTSMRWVGGKQGFYVTKTFPTHEQVASWPDDLSFSRIVGRAFMDHTITSPDDPRLAELPNVLP